MLTAEQIDAAKRRMVYSHRNPVHEHDDCVRIAYAWLDAQGWNKTISRTWRPWKHIIEAWGGRYVSQSDVELAAAMHPHVFGVYPHFNISARLARPWSGRLQGIGEAGKHSTYAGRYEDVYKDYETEHGFYYPCEKARLGAGLS